MPVWLIRILPYACGVAFILGCGIYIYRSGVVTGRAQIQVKFDAFVRASDAVVAKQKVDNEAKRIATESNNAEVLAALSAQRDRAVADRAVFARQLHDYLAKASSSAVPESPSGPAAPTESQSSSLAAIATALVDFRSECIDNANRQDALIDELVPQL